MNPTPMVVAILTAAPFILGWLGGHMESARPSLPARQADLDPVVELIIRFGEERSVERKKQILSLLGHIDHQRSSLRFLLGLANDSSLLAALRREAITILIGWDSKGAMRAAEAIVDGRFERRRAH